MRTEVHTLTQTLNMRESAVLRCLFAASDRRVAQLSRSHRLLTSRWQRGMEFAI